MHRLARYVRFCVDPFDVEVRQGSNPYSAKPTAQGLALFLELGVQVIGPVESTTGFVIDVLRIDEAVRHWAVPCFVDHVRDCYGRHTPIGLSDVAVLLRTSQEHLKDHLGTARLDALSLKLSPFRYVEIRTEDPDMVYYSEKFEFAAMHRLWNQALSRSENLALFGKCANPAGHGHNYVMEVIVRVPSDQEVDPLGLERVVDERFVQVVDHRSLNADVPYFAQLNPTMENIARFAWQGLVGRLGTAELYCVTIWESDRTSCSYYGE